MHDGSMHNQCKILTPPTAALEQHIKLCILLSLMDVAAGDHITQSIDHILLATLEYRVD
jgi:hypothetical protein